MRIEQITLCNFRRFSELRMSFHPRLTVIVAKNGQGKTSILDGSTVALGSYFSSFEFGQARNFDRYDAKYISTFKNLEKDQCYPVSVSADVYFSKQPHQILRELRGPKGRTTTGDAFEINQYAKSLAQSLTSNQEVSLPLLAYYGSGRLWNSHKNMKRKLVLTASRSMGYEDCFSAASSYKQVQEWMIKATFAVIQEGAMGEDSGSNLKRQLACVQNSINQVLESEGWRNFHYSIPHEELAMTHDQLGPLPVSLLSDGVRAMVSMVADMAWRCAKLNPHFGEDAAQKTEGIVLIDEVDMHLHPEWQQRVIQSLTKTFPNIQFIVTTHSPQVLSTVPRESIRVLSEFNGEMIAEEPKAHSYGEPSNDVLEAIMGVDPQPPIAEKQSLDRLTELVDQGDYASEEAKNLSSLLQEKLNKAHPQLQKIERSIRRQQFLKGETN
ncbi:AAA family ATPase [Thiomicrospira microaerophila]|uniref:AAA family ATPase n=1 Tax=Thiomicrospira microaerophila TaxID=406020 RepID=UPI0005C8B4C0|nr:AAA family ATPase [Thiomicrospira microaerophila]